MLKIFKMVFIVLAGIAILLLTAQFVIKQSSSGIETYSYEVIDSIDNVEIRKYEKALFTEVEMGSSEYKEISRSGFRVLADYIFGGNEKNQKIAMTSPVSITMDSASKMRFMVPGNMKREDLPRPNNNQIEFIEEEAKVMAAIQFSGWANDSKIGKYKQQLIKVLDDNNIRYTGEFSYFGYNPPYEIINRRNEIVVELDQ